MLFLLGCIENDAMNITEDILQALFIGLVVATYLLNTGRALQAIKVCKECLILLNSRVVNMLGEMFNFLNIGIYRTIFRAYFFTHDLTEALIYGSKLLHIFRQCGRKNAEQNLTILLANICGQQYRYLEAIELYKKAINIAKEIGDRHTHAYANENVGIISCRLGDYDKGKDYLEKALAIQTQIADKQGQATSYGNLGGVFSISWSISES